MRAQVSHGTPESKSVSMEARPKSQNAEEVFLSYARKDAKWRDELLTMLSPLLRNGTLDLWYDGKIKPSQKWRQEIQAAMGRAGVGVLLVSKHFLASEFISNNELPFLIEAAQKANVKLTWVLISHCSYEGQQFAGFQALHDLSKPLAAVRGSVRDQVLKQIAQSVRDMVTRPKDLDKP